MPKKIEMTRWIMSEHGVPDSKLTNLKELTYENIIGNNYNFM